MTDKDRKNCTTIFLLPGIGHHRQELLQYGFISAYLDDIEHEVHHEDCIYTLFKPDNMILFQEFLKVEYRSSPVVEDYDYEGGYIVVVYKFPDKFMTEYNLCLEGKYSKFSSEYKKLFPDKIKTEKGMTNSLQHRIFNRTEDIKKYWEKKIGEKLPADMELWSSPDMSKEVLDITLFNEKS